MFYRLLCIILLVLVVYSQENKYQLEFDWKATTKSVLTSWTLRWNSQKLGVFRQTMQANVVHHEKFNIDFNEGVNLINLFYFGLKGDFIIDNVKITKPPKNINLLVNGDFQMPKVENLSQTFSHKIPGWNGHKVILTKQNGITNKNQGLVLNSEIKNINQKISYGRTKAYSFRKSVQKQVQVLIDKIQAKKQQNSGLCSSIQQQVVQQFEHLRDSLTQGAYQWPADLKLPMPKRSQADGSSTDSSSSS